MAATAPDIPALTRDRAFEILYRTYVHDVYRYVLALLRNPADAEDVTQTTFLNAYRAFRRGEQISKPRNWLIKIAHNAARTRYARAGSRVKEVPLEDHLGELAVPEDARPDVTIVLEALAELPLNQRAALAMRELGGRTYAEIADTLGLSVSAVETLIFRARRSLRLRASSLRALGLVPLPGSLAQLVDTGAVVGSGGTLAASGLLWKLALAVIAGVVSTGIGADQLHRAQASPRSPAVDSVSDARATSARTGLAETNAPRSHVGPRTTLATTLRTSDRVDVNRGVAVPLAGTVSAPVSDSTPNSSSPPPAPRNPAPLPAAPPLSAPPGALPVPSLPAVPEAPPVPSPPIPALPALP